jgi:hypothetical protein
MNSPKGYLLIGRSKSSKILKQKQTSGKALAAVCLPEKNAVTQSLQSLTARGAKTIFIAPVSRLPKCSATDAVPLAIEQFRRKNLNLDFHYTSLQKRILDLGSWIMEHGSNNQDPTTRI